MSDSESTAELFDRHGAFVRRVARQLCRDDADADDLAQDTWAEALRRPPERWSSPRGWLARVARRLAIRRGRGERRRLTREAAVARPEVAAEPADQALVLQDLVSALVELDEATRRLVVARHFEGLELAALARREGVSLTTVKTRLRAAHARLRTRLDERWDGDRRAWLAALAPFAVPAPPVPPTLPHSRPIARPNPAARPVLPLAAGAAFVGMKLQLALAASVVALATVGILRWSDTEIAGPTLPVDRVEARGAEVAALETSRAPEIERAAAEATAPLDEVPAVASSPLSTLAVAVTDLDGIPAAGVEVFAAPPRQALNLVGQTDGAGRIELRWRGPSGVRELVVAVRSKGAWLGGLRRLTVPAGSTRTLRFAADGALLPDAASAFVTGVVLRGSFEGQSLRLVGNSLSLRPVLEGAEAPDARRRPGGLLPEVQRDGADGLVFVAGGQEGQRDGQLSNVVLSWGGVVADEEDTATVEGVVRDLSGRAAGSVRVVARADGEGEGWSAETRTRPSGGFELQVSAGKIVVEVADAELGGEELRLDLAPGSRHVWEPYLDRGLTLVGEVHDAAGQPRAEVFVEASCATPDGTWLAIARTDAAGRFVVPRCPAPLLSLDVLRERTGLPALRVGAVTLGGEPWTLVLDDASGVVSGVVRDEAPESPLASELRVWDPERARGVRVPLTNRAGDPVSTPIPPGAWLVSVGARSSHWSDEIPVDVRADEEVDLGAISLGPTGWLALPEIPEAERWRVVCAREGGAEAEVFAGRLAPDAALPLPPGTYRVERRGEGPTVLEEHEVEVHATRTSTL